MRLTKIVIIINIWIIGTSYVNAQNLIPDKIPYRPLSQPKVRHLPPLSPFMLPADDNTVDLYTQFGEDIVTTAKKYLGARYSRGGMGPRRFDCSGFTTFVYLKNNVKLLRSSRAQYTQGKIVERSQLQKGDLVFFGGSRRRNIVGHVGIVTDTDAKNNSFSFVHAAETGVIISKSTEPYYSTRYIGARRIQLN